MVKRINLFKRPLFITTSLALIFIAGWLYVRYRRTGGSEMMKDENSINNHLFKEG